MHTKASSVYPSARLHRWTAGFLLMTAVLPVMSSCRRTLTEVDEVPADVRTAKFDDVMVHSSNLPLFCDLSAFSLLPVTKADRMADDTLLSVIGFDER